MPKTLFLAFADVEALDIERGGSGRTVDLVVRMGSSGAEPGDKTKGKPKSNQTVRVCWPAGCCWLVPTCVRLRPGGVVWVRVVVFVCIEAGGLSCLALPLCALADIWHDCIGAPPRCEGSR